MISGGHKPFFFKIFDAISSAGGFIYCLRIFFNIFVGFVNKKLYISYLLENSFLIKKNDDFLCVKPGYVKARKEKDSKILEVAGYNSN